MEADGWTAVKTAVGDTLTLAYRIQNHTESGLSTVETLPRTPTAC